MKQTAFLENKTDYAELPYCLNIKQICRMFSYVRFHTQTQEVDCKHKPSCRPT